HKTTNTIIPYTTLFRSTKVQKRKHSSTRWNGKSTKARASIEATLAAEPATISRFESSDSLARRKKTVTTPRKLRMPKVPCSTQKIGRATSELQSPDHLV